MKKIVLPLSIAFILFINSFSGLACRTMGADFSWTCVGQDSFLITLNYYYDCNACGAGSVSIPIKCATTGSSITTLSIPKPTPIDITPTCPDNCTRCETSSCSFPYGIEQYTYTKLVVLSSAGSCCKIKMSYANCCRCTTITTGAANQNFYIEAVLDRCVSPCDNSPKLSMPPVITISKDQSFSYNPGAYDTDTNASGGLIDSISYEWTSPLKGVNSPISYSTPYAYNKPIYFWGFPDASLSYPKGFHLNPLNGDISFRPIKVEETVMVLKVTEWREINGVMTDIGFLTRDFKVIVLNNTTNNISPTMSASFYKEVCVGETVNFTISTNDNNFNDTLTLNWNCQIPGASWSDNNGSVKHPTGTFSWTPNTNHVSTNPYSFTVTVQDDACPLNGRCTRAFQILVKPGPEASFSVADSGCGHYYFTARDSVGKNPFYTWSVAGNSITGKNANFKFNYPGIHPYSLTIEAQQCSTQYFDTLEIDTFLSAELVDDFDICYHDTVKLSPSYINNKGNVFFNWSTGDTSQTIEFPVISDTMIRVVVSDTSVCKSSDSLFINMHQLPAVDLGPDHYLCVKNPDLLEASYSFDQSGLKNINWYDKTGSLILSGQNHQLNVYDSGSWTCKVEDTLGCLGTDTVKVFINPEMKAFAADVTICAGDTATLTANPTGSQTSNTEYKWFYKGTSTLAGNTQIIKISPTYTTEYVLIVNEQTGGVLCGDTSMVTVHVNSLPAFLWQGAVESCIDGPVIDLNSYISTTPSHVSKTWTSLSPGLLPDYPGDKFHPFKAGAGKHAVVLTVVDTVTGCIISDSSFVTIHQLPKPDAGKDADICKADELISLDGKPDSPAGDWYSLLGVGLIDTNGLFFFDPNATGVSDGTSYPLAYHYTDSNGCENEDTLHISVNKITADFESDPMYGTSPLTIHFKDKSDAQLLTLTNWFWIFGDSNTSMLTNPSHTFIDKGNYSISLWVSDGRNCMDSITKNNFIHVSPNIGIQEQPHSVLQVYPNPANNELIIKFINTNELINSVYLINLEGKLLDRFPANSLNEIHISGISQPSGLYYLKINSSKGSSYYRKIMIE